MLVMTNSFHDGKCCALCKYWCGEAVMKYNAATGATIYDDSIDGGCEYHLTVTLADELCDKFRTEFIYSRYFR